MHADRIKEIFAPFGEVAVKRMFGGAGVYRDGLCFAIESDGEIYIKVDDANRDAFRAAGSKPFAYSMKGELREMGYWRLVDAAHDDPSELRRWAGLGFAAAERAAEKKAKGARLREPKSVSAASKAKASRRR